jgi:lincosamide nucleotidyltransferase A/C/D/E
MEAAQVLALFRDFERSGWRVWAAGGWAVDAVVGRQTRPHRDLDIAVDASQLAGITSHLQGLGYRITIDERPSRLELTDADGAAVDIHPVSFAPDGTGIQAGLNAGSFHYAADGFTVGVLDGRAIPCLSIRQQLAFRDGYALRATDRHDIELLLELERNAQRTLGAPR